MNKRRAHQQSAPSATDDPHKEFMIELQRVLKRLSDGVDDIRSDIKELLQVPQEPK